MSQPVSEDQFSVVSGGVGTTVVSAIGATVRRVIIPGTFVGTLKLHDAPSAAGTTASSNFLTLGLPTTSIPQSIEVGVTCNKGIVFEATGTPTATIVWGR